MTKVQSKSNDFATNYDDDPYTPLNNAVLRNPRLSFKAIGLWARCRSFDKTWKFYKSKIIADGKDGLTAVNSAFSELESEGLMVVILHRIVGTKDGKKINRIWGNEYVFFPKPMSEKVIKDVIKKRKEAIQIFFLKAGFLSEALVVKGNQPLRKNKGKNEQKEETTEDVVDEFVDNSRKSPLSLDQEKKLRKNYPEEYDLAHAFMMKQKGEITKPVAWLTNCLKNEWHKKEEQKNYRKEENRKFSKKIIKEYSHCLLNGSSFDMTEEGFIIYRGTKYFKFLFGMINFQDKLLMELKKMGIIVVS